MKVAARYGSPIWCTPGPHQARRTPPAHRAPATERPGQLARRGPGQAAHRAVGAVAAEQVPRADGPVRPALATPQDGVDAVVVLGQGDELDAGLEPDPRLPRHRATEDRLQVGLVEQRAPRPAVRAVVGVADELDDRAHPPVEQPEPRHRPAGRQDVVRHPGGLQDTEHLVVQVHRTGQGIGRGVPLDQVDLDPAAREQQRRRQPHRSGADDQHRDLGHALSLPGPFADDQLSSAFRVLAQRRR